MAESLSNLKQKNRYSSGSDFETLSTNGKRTCEASSNKIHSTASSNDTDQILIDLTMSEGITQQLQKILDRLTSVERKLDGVFQKVNGLEKAINNVQADIEVFKIQNIYYGEVS